MGKFHIEDDWYIIPDVYGWVLAKRKVNEKAKKEWADMTYHRTPNDALRRYCEKHRAEKARRAADGTIYDLVDIFTKENERLSELLKIALPDVQVFEEEERSKHGTEGENLHRDHQR